MKLMEGKIKKLFIFAFIFGLILLLPFQFVQAQGGILGALMAIPINIISILLQVLLLVSNLIVGIAGLILNRVLSPYFTSLPYTYGGIVDVGWPIVRDFTNMFFVIALVVIGLATALRIKEYQLQKALPRLIIIAILINFTPVICGLIMDASNIFMNFFLEEVTGFKLLGNLFATQGTALWQSLIHFADIRYAATLLGKTIGMIMFDWVAAFVFLMYAILFIMRYIMVWVLVIVSPLAFFSWVFPGSQKYLFKSILGWEEWWKQFIEWSMIGIIGAFFLYLGEQLLILAPAMISPLPPDLAWGWLTIPVVEFINNLLPYGVVLAFLIIGFFTATSTSAMGAGAITSFFKEQGMAIGKAAMFPLQRLGVQGIAGTAGLLGKVGGLTGKWAGGLEKIPYVGKAFKPVGWMAKGFEAGAVAPLRRYAVRARRVDFDEMFKGMEAGEMAEQIGTLLSKGDRVSAGAWMKGKGVFDKVPGKSVPDIDPETGEQRIDPETGLPKTKMINPFHDQMAKEAGDLVDKPEHRKSATDVLEALAGKVDEKVSLKLEADPTAKANLRKKIGEIAEEISKDEKIKVEIETIARTTGLSSEQVARDMAAREILVGGLKSGDVKDMAKSSFDDIGVRRGMRKWSSAHMSALQNNFKKDTIDKALNQPGGLNAIFEAAKTPEEGKAILEKLYEENPRIVHFFATSPPGREWAWKGREFMPKTEGGRPDFGAFEVEMELKKKLEKAPPELKSFYGEITTDEEEIRKFEEEIPKFQKLQEEAKRKRLPVEERKAKDEITALRSQIGGKRDEIQRKIEGLSPELRIQWDEIEKLRISGKVKGRPPIPPTPPIPPAKRERIEGALTSELEKEKKAKGTIADYEKAIKEWEEALPKAKTPEERVEIKRNIETTKGYIKDQKEELKTIHQRVKRLNKDYREFWEKEEERIKERASTIGKETLQGASVTVKDLEDTYNEAKKMEIELDMEATRLAKREGPAPGAGTEADWQTAFTETERKHKEAVEKRKSIELQFKPTKQLFSSGSKRLESLNEAVVTLETARKDALLKGDLEKKAKIEEAQKKLPTERDKVLSELGRIQSKEILGTLDKREEREKNAEKAYQTLTSHENVKAVRSTIRNLEKEFKSPSKTRTASARSEWEAIPPDKQGETTVAGIAHRQIAKEIDISKGRVAFEGTQKMENEYKRILTDMEKARQKLDDLEAAKIKAIEQGVKEKWEKIENQINAQKKKRTEIINKLGNLPNKINELIKEIEKEGL